TSRTLEGRLITRDAIDRSRKSCHARRSRWWKFLDKHFPPRPDFLLDKILWTNFHDRNQFDGFTGFLSARKVLQFEGSLFWNTLGELLRRHGSAPEIDRKDRISVMVELARCQKCAERKLRKPSIATFRLLIGGK